MVAWSGLVGGLIACVLGCSASSPAARADLGAATDAAADNAGAGAPVDCAEAFPDGKLSTRWWTESPPASCVAAPLHRPKQAYDRCDANPSYPANTCGMGQSRIVCVEGRLTMSCNGSGDCPDGMGCDSIVGGSSSGYCQKLCTGSGDPSDCIRCDLACTPWGLCNDKPPDPGPPCVADCQCPEDGVCLNGLCNNDVPLGPRGICGGDGDCACTGAGQCVGKCCLLSDGSIAAPDSPECGGS